MEDARISRTRAKKAVARVIADIESRKHLGDTWEEMGAEVNENIETAWIEIVLRVLREETPEPVKRKPKQVEES